MILPVAHLDFETFSKLPLKGTKSVGTCRYAEDPSTELLCFAYAIGDEEAPTVWEPHHDDPERLFDHVAAGGLVYAWNVEMEIPAWYELCVKRRGWPMIPFAQWRDTAAVALSLALPAALGNCGAALGLEIQKDQRGKHLVNKLCKPRRPSKNDPSTRWTPEKVPKDYEDLYAYCARDVEAERAIHQALPRRDLNRRELSTWRMTTKMNLRGWAIDSGLVDRMIDLLSQHRKYAHAEISELTGGAVTTDNQREKALDWLAGQGVNLPDWTKDTIETALKRDASVVESSGSTRIDGRKARFTGSPGMRERSTSGEPLPDNARRLLELRQELGKSSVKKYDAMKRRLCADGTVKNNVLYHGASTGRDAGRGIQIHNFPIACISKDQAAIETAVHLVREASDPIGAVEIVYEDFPHFASKMLRSALVSRPNHDLLAADFSNVENRIAVWYARCQYGIEIFEKGLDEYKQFATELYSVAYDDVTTDQRYCSKHGVLGCIYGQAWRSLQAQMLRFGLSISDDHAKRVVAMYRELYAELVQMWYDLNDCAIYTVRTDEPTRCGRIKFEIRGDFLCMVLASGRAISFYKPKVEKKRTPWGQKKDTVTHMGVGRTHKWERLKIVPGRYFGMAVQGTARDLMMRGARATAKAEYTLVGRVHDELISEVPEGFGSLSEYCGLMIEKPSWLRGVKIEAEGWRGKRYRK